MATRLALTLVEWMAVVIAIPAAVSATGSASLIDITTAGLAAIVAATARAIANSRAAGRRFDAALEALRAARPSNRTGGL